MINYDLEKLVETGDIVSYHVVDATAWSTGEVFITFPSGQVMNIAGTWDPELADITIDVY